jgi:hypothetical protein
MSDMFHQSDASLPLIERKEARSSGIVWRAVTVSSILPVASATVFAAHLLYDG